MSIAECKKCNNTESFRLEYGERHTGLICGNCGSWIKWVGKKEIPIIENYIKTRKLSSSTSFEEAKNTFKLNIKNGIEKLGLSKEEMLDIVMSIFNK